MFCSMEKNRKLEEKVIVDINKGYFICNSCTKLNHGWTYVEVAGI